jgi:predicted Co/Zn/Cd cation transporter (cation efflux family)
VATALYLLTLIWLRRRAHASELVAAEAVEVCSAMGLPAPVIRMTKTGCRLYVEVDHLVAPGEWDVAEIDRLRHALTEGWRLSGVTTWINVELSCSPVWQEG